MAAKTNAQKQADRRVRLSCGGLFKRRDFWCHHDDEPKLRALEKQLKDERKKSHNAALTRRQTRQIEGAVVWFKHDTDASFDAKCNKQN